MAELMSRPTTTAGPTPARPEKVSTRLQAAVYDRVRGGTDTVRELSAELEVSERLVRGAVKRLTAEGLLQVEGRRLVAPAPPATYGQRSRAVRRARGWSQLELARQLLRVLGGSSAKSLQSSVSAIERGREPGERWREALDQVLADGWSAEVVELEPETPPATPTAVDQEPEDDRLARAHAALFEVARLLDQLLDEECRGLPITTKAALVAGELRGRRGAA